MAKSIQAQAEAFLTAWFETRRLVQALNFNRFQQEGLSASQFILLTMLGEAEASPAELAARLNVGVTTSMRTAESLAARGLVTRREDANDRRRSMLALTEQGRQVHARMHAIFMAQVSDAFRAMPPALRFGLVEGLGAFVAELKPYALAQATRSAQARRRS